MDHSERPDCTCFTLVCCPTFGCKRYIKQSYWFKSDIFQKETTDSSVIKASKLIQLGKKLNKGVLGTIRSATLGTSTRKKSTEIGTWQNYLRNVL